MPSLCNRGWPTWIPRPRLVSSRVELDLGGVSWRYFTALHCNDALSNRCVRLFFKDAVSERAIASVQSNDGLIFDQKISNMINTSWLLARMTHNAAITRSAEDILVVGGEHNREPPKNGERPNDGVWLTRWKPSDKLSRPRWLFNGSHPGCVERRTEVEGKWLHPGADVSSRACGFDGRLSLVFHRGHWLLYARANTKTRGYRSVQVSKSIGDEPTGPWGPFRQLSFHGFPAPVAGGGPDVYYFLVQDNPAWPGSLVATFPFFHLRNGCTALAFSNDGVRWSQPVPLVPCAVVDRKGGRTLCHPTNLLSQGGGAEATKEAVLYIHDSVPMSDKRGHKQQPPAHLTQHRIEIEYLARLTRKSITEARLGKMRPNAKRKAEVR